MAAALLLCSLHQDESLTALTQTLYDLQTLTFEKVYDQLSVEDGRKESTATKSAYAISQMRRKDKS
jgi:hypothetical protein